jgi:hypothetical protein
MLPVDGEWVRKRLVLNTLLLAQHDASCEGSMFFAVALVGSI